LPIAHLDRPVGNALDEHTLSKGVRLAIEAMYAGQLAFQRDVLSGDRGIRTQVVSKRQRPNPLAQHRAARQLFAVTNLSAARCPL
jgi:hypothetical protein